MLNLKKKRIWISKESTTFQKIPRIEKHIKWHHRDAFRKICNIGNSTGQANKYLQQINHEEKKIDMLRD